MRARTLFAAVLLGLLALPESGAAESRREFGFARVDVTPANRLRLSGYGNRTEPAVGVDESLFVRVMALRPAGGSPSVLASIDTIGLSGRLAKEIATRVDDKHGIPRSGVVLSSTHSHTAPHLPSGLVNLLAVPLTAEEKAQSVEYEQRLVEQILAAIDQAIEDLQPGRLFAAEGSAGFARNRRLIRQGRWTGFGESPEGPVDHAVPLLKIVDDQGALRGVVFNYACHCTTFGGGYNRVNGDWAGYASQRIEQSHPAATALCLIGCGGDQNPQRDDDPAVALRLAKSQGQQLAAEVERLISGPMRRIDGRLTSSFGFAGLPVDRPSIDELRKAAEDRRPQTRRHAQNMLAVHKRMGRLPETYPAPVQAWRFGDELCMVFLGGEVVVDYALRMKREIDCGLVWVSAYCNDVFGYVASERMRSEGGYEVDGSMIYYNQPGRWAEGTEETLVRRIHELVDQGEFSGPFSPEEALKTFQLAPDWQIEIVAAEPLVADPVNFAVGADGRLWVVEMGDYPSGGDGQGAPAGRVKLLEDRDGDGRYERGEVFLDGLSYPNGIFPWRDGVLVSAAGSILYAKDVDGDQRADTVATLFRGFDEGNPQHRMAGFCYGLDNWLYLSAGAHNGPIVSSITGATVDVAGQDFRIQPDLGLIEPVGGHTQYGRCRDDWGNWFGGDNSRPMWHYLIPDRYLSRNPYVAAPDFRIHLLAPEFSPPVFPTSRTLDRFNDLFALNRFTSACSPAIFRDASIGDDVDGAAFICEPVHNLVHRAMLNREGATFRATRHASETAAEFLTSTDHWFRPTACATGPDGALWVVDMYRHVIEHPQWIPEAWQEQLDLRAGRQQGRIYRVYHKGSGRRMAPNLQRLSSAKLVAELSHANGWRRDTAQRLLVQRNDPSVVARLEELYETSDNPIAKVHVLGTLEGLGRLTAEHVSVALYDPNARLQHRALVLSEPLLAEAPALRQSLMNMVDQSDPCVRLQLALTLGETRDDAAADALVALALASGPDNDAMTAAVLSSAPGRAAAMLVRLLRETGATQRYDSLTQDLIATAIGIGGADQIGPILQAVAPSAEATEPWQFEALAAVDRALRRHDGSFAKLAAASSRVLEGPLNRVAKIIDRARQSALNEQAPIGDRQSALKLLGRGLDRQDEDIKTLARVLAPQQPVELQLTAVDCLSQFRSPAIAEFLLQDWNALTPQVRSAALSALLSRRPWRESFLAAVEAGDIPVIDVDAAARAELTSAGDADLRRRARALFAVATAATRSEAFEKFRNVDDLTGGRRRGVEQFSKTCAACHRHRGVGNDYGPKLAALTDKSTDTLVASIVDPSRAIEKKYVNYTCLTADGVAVSGMIIAESGGSVTFAQPNGEKITVLRVDIDELASSGVSFMPEGLDRDLAPQDLADLLAFVRTAEEASSDVGP